jgi:hypothetical protein
MFKIRLRKGIFPEGWKIAAKAVTLRQALGFIGEFSELRNTLIKSSWQDRDGQYVMDVYD